MENIAILILLLIGLSGVGLMWISLKEMGNAANSGKLANPIFFFIGFVGAAATTFMLVGWMEIFFI